jgi:hypothetical protein
LLQLWEAKSFFTNKSFQQFRKTGAMTVRELLQQVGEAMFLKMYPRIWLDQFATKVNEERADLWLNPGPRKPEQIDEIHRLGGKVIRLLRNPHPEDRHISETALDLEVYDQSNFDAIIDNRNLTIAETNMEVYQTLFKWGWVPALQHGGDNGCVDTNKVVWT